MATTLFHISDIHFGVEDPLSLDAVARAVTAEKPDVVVCTGDLTQRAKKSEYRDAARWLAGLDAPVVVSVGNHDMPYYNLWERFTDPYRRYRQLESSVSGSLASDDVVLIHLKTTVRVQPRFPWSDGVVTRAALGEAIASLRALEDDQRTKIVMAHHPLLGPAGSSKNPTIGGDRAFSAIAAAGADAVLSGHVHVPFDEIREAGGETARMIGAGTISTRLRHGAPPSYRVITCEKGGVIKSELRETRRART